MYVSLVTSYGQPIWESVRKSRYIGGIDTVIKKNCDIFTNITTINSMAKGEAIR